MRTDVIISIRGRQAYLDQEPDEIELVTDGTLERCADTWNIQYEETELTGLAGTTTLFQVEADKITLSRTGKLTSQMVFQEGVVHDSLYQMEFGALMLSVCAKHIHSQLSIDGGSIDLLYGIEIEHSAAGEISYHLDIRPKV